MVGSVSLGRPSPLLAAASPTFARLQRALPLQRAWWLAICSGVSLKNRAALL